MFLIIACGLALGDVSQIDFRMRVEETGGVLVVLDAAPFDIAARRTGLEPR